MVTFCKEGGGRLLVWALRACSYKNRAEARQQGNALHHLQGVFLVFVLLPVREAQKFKGSRSSKVQGFKRTSYVPSVVRKRNEEDEETLADKSSTAHEHVHRTYHAGDRGPGHGARMGELYSLQPWTGRRARVYIPTDACGQQAERGLAWTDDTLDGQAWTGFLAGYTSVHQRGGCPEA